MDADDGQSAIAVTRVPTPYRRQGVTTVVTAKGPKFDEHYPAAQLFQSQRIGIDPVALSELGRGVGFRRRDQCVGFKIR